MKHLSQSTIDNDMNLYLYMTSKNHLLLPWRFSFMWKEQHYIHYLYPHDYVYNISYNA
jgi:hypothetical protein